MLCERMREYNGGSEVNAIIYNLLWLFVAWMIFYLAGIAAGWNRRLVMAVSLILLAALVTFIFYELITNTLPEQTTPWYYYIGSVIGGLTGSFMYGQGKKDYVRWFVEPVRVKEG